MPRFGPIKRRDFIRYMRRLGWEGPYPGSKHPYLDNGHFLLRIPNEHEGDISRELLDALLKQAGINRTEWEQL
jgi:predicted RNA binding protein YcfA (HicA-like mRNA interferase family)